MKKNIFQMVIVLTTVLVLSTSVMAGRKKHKNTTLGRLRNIIKEVGCGGALCSLCLRLIMFFVGGGGALSH